MRQMAGGQIRVGGARGGALIDARRGGAVARGGGAARPISRSKGGGTKGSAVSVACGWAKATQSGQMEQSPCG